jgi:hypothetical protein
MGQAVKPASYGIHAIIDRSFPTLRSKNYLISTTYDGYNPP